MKMILQTASIIASLLAFSAANANELLVTSASAKSANNNAIALDVSSDGSATALQIRLDVGKDQKVDLSKCVSALPSSHSGTCGYKNGRVTVLVYSDRNEMLPAGVVSIGSIVVNSDRSAKAKAVSLAQLMAFDRNGDEVSISSVLD